jgi:8-oxo-dGTP diphosphatase / 2-hydroxy-dATP diphosphatase
MKYMTKQMKTLTLLFLRRENQVLLAMKLRGFGAGRWNGVGGKLEPGESIEQAMIRETKEEIGIEPRNYEKVGELHFDEYFKGEPTLMNVHVFTATDWQGTPAASEEMAPKWFNVKQIPYDDMWPDDTYWLPQVLDGKKLTADFVLDEQDSITSSDVHIVDNLL